MPVNVRFAKSALADLQAIQSWYNKQGVPEMGARLVEEIITCVEPLAEHPDLGRVVPEFGQSSLREITHRSGSCIDVIRTPCVSSAYGAVNAGFS